ncbi:ankyrin repeat protein [Seminavis robusta]|uniref:Ankyrin repeat protein n=1 Tax=Seminavis robusta TaxID=568900 RepID=A0A9N8DXN0_9STRA|nr:ankyrin repeat protein [Seminavis robusta]|eukprot:Sro454_g146410.1 ankyrin repeat protein (219) ;mRNA; f:50921-51577
MNTNAAANDEGIAESPHLFADDLIWSGQILSFVGVGQYAFVGAVNKQMNKAYKEYCKIELKKNPRKVWANNYSPSRSAEITDTLCCETFCNQPRTECWLKDNSSTKTPDRWEVCTAIAKIGNIMVMQWAHQQGFPWNERTCSGAAAAGHLEIFKWARENGCPWDVQTCASAAEGGHWKFSSGLVRKGVHGMNAHARVLLQPDIWKFSSGLVKMGVHGM